MKIIRKIAASGYLKALGLICLLVLSFVYAMFQGGFVSWFLFFSFTPFMAYMLVLRFYPMGSIHAERLFHRDSYKAGEDIHVKISVRMRWPFPIMYLIVEDGIPGKLKPKVHGSHKTVMFPMFRKEFSYIYTISAAKRGEHRFNNIRISTGDMLGFYDRKAVIECRDKILIYPRYETVGFSEAEAVYEHGNHASPVQNQSEHTIVTGVRDYLPGDRISWIHWKATAKRNEFMTKEFEERKGRDAIIILDQTPSKEFEELVALAASLTHSLLKKGTGVGYAGTNGMTVPIGHGKTQRESIFYRLAIADDTEMETIDHHLRRINHSFFSNTGIIVLTSMLTKELIESLCSLKGNSPSQIFVMQESTGHVPEALQGMAFRNGIKCRFLKPGTWHSAVEKGVG